VERHARVDAEVWPGLHPAWRPAPASRTGQRVPKITLRQFRGRPLVRCSPEEPIPVVCFSPNQVARSQS
jgi:hypothetical protein